MISASTIQIVLSSIGALIYFSLALGYELWLWKRGMNDFRKWLGKKLGYSIQVNTGFRSISWKIDVRAPAITKICLMIVSNTFFLLAGMFPIFLLAIIIFLIWNGCELGSKFMVGG